MQDFPIIFHEFHEFHWQFREHNEQMIKASRH